MNAANEREHSEQAFIHVSRSLAEGVFLNWFSPSGSSYTVHPDRAASVLHPRLD